MNTTIKGDTFRDEVAGLLRASGVEVETERLKGHKRGDLFFETRQFGTLKRYAVEAKNWARALNHGDLETIYGGYVSLIQSRVIDELIIVSPVALTSPAAKAFIAETSGLAHLTLNEFQESLLGFNNYLTAFVHRHDQDGLEGYYVQPIIEGGRSLEDHVFEWLDSDRGDPIAIIASYGMGKTSFAQHVSSILAKRFLAGEPGRVPIMVGLGAISREQSLEGLIGTVLAGGAPTVTNYSFKIFSHLNEIGRFLIILDGFDEMKHMMTEAEFRTNFEQLNRLVAGRAKLLLLGRPSAFLSEDERAYVLRGVRRIGSQTLRLPGAPHYDELKLVPFSPAQVREFLKGYFEYLVASGKIAASADLLERRRVELEDVEHELLISRPVHARMLADLATDPNFEIKGLTRFALYDHFIDHLIEREMMKGGRGSVLKSDDRRTFACDLAWHLWTNQATSALGCRIDELPPAIFKSYVPAGEELDSVRRSLLSGSFLDEKPGGIFFFSHRSFQEFLVAEYIWSNFSEEPHGRLAVRNVDKALTPDVYAFLIERDDAAFFRSLLSGLAASARGVSLETFELLITSRQLLEISAARSVALMSGWDAAVNIAAAMSGDPATRAQQTLRACQAVARGAARKPTILLVALKTVLAIGRERKIPIVDLGPCLVAILFARALDDLAALSSTALKRSRSDPLRDMLFDNVAATLTPSAGIRMRVDLSDLFEALKYNVAQPMVTDTEPPIAVNSYYEADFQEFFRQLEAPVREKLFAFYKRDAEADRGMDRAATDLREDRPTLVLESTTYSPIVEDDALDA